MCYFPTLDAMRSAAEKLKGVSTVTPLVFNQHASNEHRASVFLKREDLQPVRSYKIRGAFNKMKSLSTEELGRGVVCASAGNHAQGVALSCKILNAQGTIFMPVTTPDQKVEQVRMFGGENVKIMLYGDTFDDANERAIAFCTQMKASFIHPFDDEKVIEGQGTVGLEIYQQLEERPDFVFVPVGGGGLAAGVGAALKELWPTTKVIGVEPKGAPSLTESLKNKKNSTLQRIEKFVDGAAVKRIGERNFEICRNVLDDVLVVDEGKICETILSLYSKDAIVTEPAGALTLASLEQYSAEICGKKVVCVLSGGNNDITRTEEIRERALLHQGRKHYFIVKFPQRAGALKEFISGVLGPHDDITHFEYTKKNSKTRGAAVVGIEVSNQEDFSGLENRMKNLGFFEKYVNEDPYLMSFIV